MEAINYNFDNNLNESIQSLLKDASIVTVTDSLGRLEYANNNFCEILKRDANSLIGETHELLKSHLHNEKLYKDLWRTIKMGQRWNGVLRDISDDDSVVEKINTKTYQTLINDGIIADGMLPKLNNCFHAINNNVDKVCIGKPDMLFVTNTNYTTIQK